MQKLNGQPFNIQKDGFTLNYEFLARVLHVLAVPQFLIKNVACPLTIHTTKTIMVLYV